MRSSELKTADLTGEYRYEAAQRACSTRYVLPLIKQLTARLPSGSTIVDAGCGNGSLLAQVQRLGSKCAAYPRIWCKTGGGGVSGNPL